MLDIKFVREHPDKVKDSEKKRGNDIKNVDKVLNYDKKWREALKDVEKLKHTRNVVSQEINQAKKKKDEKDHAHVMVKIKALRRERKKINNEIITNLPKFENDFETMHKKYYAI